MSNKLDTALIGQPLLHHASVSSTNDLAKQHARAGHAEGLLITADEQRTGRGRLGRGWAAPPGSSLLLSLLLRPSLPPPDAFLLTMLASVALCEAIEQVAPLRAGLKWPNDLMLPVPQPDGTPAFRKAAGILSEIEIARERIVWVVIGMGINVSWSPQGVVDGRDLSRSATSLSAASGQPVERMALLGALLRRLDARYAALRRGQRGELFAAWRARLVTLGTRVSVSLPDGVLHGLAEDVAPSGALRLRDDHGNVHLITAGDVGG